MGKTAREIMSGDAECIGENETVAEAARKMARLDIGSLPICGEDDRLKGMLTDRDIVVKVLAEGKDPESTNAGELGEGKPVTIGADDSVSEAIKTMKETQDPPATGDRRPRADRHRQPGRPGQERRRGRGRRAGRVDLRGLLARKLSGRQQAEGLRPLGRVRARLGERGDPHPEQPHRPRRARWRAAAPAPSRGSPPGRWSAPRWCARG